MLPIVIGIAVSALFGGVGRCLLKEYLKTLKGKKIAVIGQRAAGKTTLVSFLAEGTIPEEYEQTLSQERRDGREINLSGLDLVVTEVNDVPGGSDYYKQWKEVVDRCEVIYYLARADGIVKDDSERKRVSSDVKHLCGWLKQADSEQGASKRVFFIGTRCDLIPGFAENRGAFQDDFFRLEEMRDVRLLLGDVNAGFVLGSLKEESDVQNVVATTFKLLQQADSQGD